LAGVMAHAQKQSLPSSLAPGKAEPSSSSAIVKHTKKKKKRFAFFSPQRNAYKKPNVKHTARYEYYVRVEKAAKEKQRMLKELSKPQYSDFRYFGHKKIPKRRKPNKMRYCTECQIRH
jgi:hypothetical protein